MVNFTTNFLDGVTICIGNNYLVDTTLIYKKTLDP